MWSVASRVLRAFAAPSPRVEEASQTDHGEEHWDQSPVHVGEVL